MKWKRQTAQKNGLNNVSGVGEAEVVVEGLPPTYEPLQ